MTTAIDLSVSPNVPMDRASYPIDFSLHDDDGQAILTIADDPTEQHAHLEINNTSGADILIDAPANGTAASADHHQFELRFRPGVLSAASATQLRLDAQSGWSAGPPQPQLDGTISLYLLSTDARTLTPTEPIRLRLSQISADGGNGARGTQVELRYRQLHYRDGMQLADTKLLHLDIANQRGKKNIPLHVGFIGSHTILNDGKTSNTLTLRLTNTLETALRLNPQSSPTASKFILSFDVGEKWGLTSRSALANISLEAIDGANLDEADWDVQPGRQLGQELAWTLTHKKADASLAAGQIIQVQLGNIISSLPSGDTNLYLRYENIPGYWDGQFVCTIEKAPILYDAQGNVGIGTATPHSKLQVGDDVHGMGLAPADQPPHAGYIRFGDNTGLKLHIARSRETSNGPLNTGTTGTLMTIEDSGHVGIGTDAPHAPLTVQADSAATPEGRQIIIQGQSDTHHELALGYHTAHNYGSIQAVTQGTAVRPLVLNPAGGHVGIGIARDPNATLEVNGSIKSPMWQVMTLFGNDSGPLPLTSQTFTTGGGTLLFFVSGSAYRQRGGLIGLQIRIDDAYVGECSLSINQGNTRMPCTGTFVKTDVAAGTHRVTIRQHSDAPDMLTDGNDVFNVTLLELPF